MKVKFTNQEFDFQHQLKQQQETLVQKEYELRLKN
jgi:hypothetical protein